MRKGKHYRVDISRDLRLSSAILCIDSFPRGCYWNCFVEIHAIEDGEDHLIGVVGTGLKHERTEISNPVSIQCALNLRLKPRPPVTLYTKVISIPHEVTLGGFDERLREPTLFEGENVDVVVNGFFEFNR